MARRDFGHVLHVVALLGVGVAEGDELAVAAVAGFEAGHIASRGIGNAASHLNAARDEECLHCLQQRAVSESPAAIALDIYLVDVHLAE